MLSSANALNLDPSKSFSFGKELMSIKGFYDLPNNGFGKCGKWRKFQLTSIFSFSHNTLAPYKDKLYHFSNW